MKLRELTQRVREIERELAPGSETSLWGDYQEAMRQAVGVLPIGDYLDAAVPEDVAATWLTKYRDASKLHDVHGLTVGLRVIEDGVQPEIHGTIMMIDDEAGTCHVRWDNAHDAYDVDVDTLVPVKGW